VTGKAVVKVNGAELTDRDLLREMFALFPYAKLHGGFPKKQEAEIRQGAMQMIIFEELVYQEALRRKMTIAPARIAREEHNFKGQFASQAEFNEYLKTEQGGSEAKLRQMIKRSLLIEAMLKQEVDNKAAVTLAEARSYYEKNPKVSSAARVLGYRRFRLFLRTRRARGGRGRAQTGRGHSGAGEGDQELRAVRAAGGEGFGRRLPGGYGRPEAGGEPRSCRRKW
jgi:hypothetical protein